MPSVTLYASIAGTVTVACGGEQLTLTPEHADALIYPLRDVLAALSEGRRAAQPCAHYQVYGEADTLSLADLQTKRMIFLTIPGALNALVELPRFAALARLLSSTNHVGHPPPPSHPEPSELVEERRPQPRRPYHRTIPVH